MFPATVCDLGRACAIGSAKRTGREPWVTSFRTSRRGLPLHLIRDGQASSRDPLLPELILPSSYSPRAFRRRSRSPRVMLAIPDDTRRSRREGRRGRYSSIPG
jgi:hypothetical protein